MVEPEGQYPLTVAIRAPKKNFGNALEVSLKRFIAIRSHERGSQEEADAIQALQAELRQIADSRLGNDPYERTREIFNVAQGDLQQRFPGVFEFPDPAIRAHAAELLGTYAEREGDEGFRPGGPWDYFGAAVVGCLEDEDPDVRNAAAVAIHRFLGRPAPEANEQAVAAAARLWAEAERARAENS